jgi:ribosome recycling factor
MVFNMTLKDILENAEKRMGKTAESLRREYLSLRAGRANPAILDKITVDYYGAQTPINQTANISCPEPRLIIVQPWDKAMLSAIEKAILKSDLGLNPGNDGSVIRLNIPQLTEERRKELVKSCAKKAEESKVILRGIRRDVNEQLKALEKTKEATEDDCKKSLDKAQKTTEKYVKIIDEIFSQKEKEIMSV